MHHAPPPLAWLRAFECAARHLSFTAAAQELHVTQSAVSQQVRSLEMRLGVVLFQRKARGLALTDAGRRLLPDVSSGLDILAAASRTFDRDPPEGLLAVAASVSFNQWFIAPGLKNFLASEPGLSVRLVGTIWPDDFQTSIADVEIRFGSEKLAGSNARRLTPDELIVVCAPELRTKADRLDRHTLIESVGTTDGWRKWAEHAGYEDQLEPRIFVDSHGLAIDLARSGAGIALTSSLLASRCLADGSLVYAHRDSLPTGDGYFLAVKAREDDASVRFANWLESEIADLVEQAAAVRAEK